MREAGFWIRLGANLLDGIIVSIPLAIIVGVLTGNFDNDEPLAKLLSGLYSILLPVLWSGRTIGKRICGIRIRKYDTHEPPGIGTMLMRVIVAGLVYAITFGIGFIASVIMVAVREDKRAIHDFIAGTEVVRD
ncbi:putative RDD family membrane protein YckC [Paenibacillus pabuli]|uniref:Putative RDD family membrane protein YckC n=1 Tax=Paenibacillus pabuli TaxID=1472 RepID=A0A855Y936_9BACL|nr:putative RDD family membrane protein YckC [Paenibacillus pabuli]PXW06036.1 putative RDD family membrane protein YckC [Paenibacillus taichungensis]